MRIETTLALIAALVVACGAAGCSKVNGSGRAFTEDRRVGPFDVVETSGSFRVVIDVGNRTSCSITGDDNIVPLIQTRVQGRTLAIKATKRIDPETPVEIRLVTPGIRRLDVTGSGDAVLRGARGVELTVEVAGAADLELHDVDVDRLDLEISGAADVIGSGFARKLVYEISGAGKGKLGDLCAVEAEVEISGAGNATVAVRDRLDAEISGAGSIEYFGEPSMVRPEISGAGSIKPLGKASRCARWGGAQAQP